MATETAPDFDLGPLSWVQGEIDQALGARPGGARRVSQAAPTTPRALKHARTHVHQAAGAIQMVGLDAVVAYTDEIERQLRRLEELADPSRRRRLRGDRPRLPQAADLPRRARQRRAAGAAQAVPRIRGDAARTRHSRPWRRPTSSIPICPARADARRRRTRCRRRSCRRTWSSSAAPTSAGLLAWLRGDDDGAVDDARRGRRHRGRDRPQPHAARVLVDRPARCLRRA